MDPKLKTINFQGAPFFDPSQYRILIGRLLYLTITRPDIAYAVNRLSQFVTNHKHPHLQAVHHLLRYIKNNPGQGIFFQPFLLYNLKHSMTRIGLAVLTHVGLLLFFF